MDSSPRLGLRLIDLMVIVLLVGLMFGLLVRATQDGSGGGTRRTHCQNNLRQLGLGLLGYQNAKNRLPDAGTFFDDPAVHGGDPTKSTIYRAINDPASFANDPSPLRSSWVVEILPYIDNQELYNTWDRDRSYWDPRPNGPALPSDGPKSNGVSEPSNAALASISIGILRCPYDPTTQPNQGNLSYAVNGGFARWHAIPVGWSAGARDGQSKNGPVLQWVAPGGTWQESQAVGRKLGVMFLGTHTGDQPWDIRTTPSDIIDGASQTLLVGENTLVGDSRGTSYSGGLETNWACPLPNFCMFLASDDVCRSPRAENDCLGGQLRAVDTKTSGPGWARANQEKTWENINYGQTLTIEGSFPFANSGHAGGANFVFCDGAVRYISTTIDGTVYARIITPAGENLPAEIRQTPLSAGAFEP
jgi:prepilin-type processing-associated H-X9-DG protein